MEDLFYMSPQFPPFFLKGIFFYTVSCFLLYLFIIFKKKVSKLFIYIYFSQISSSRFSTVLRVHLAFLADKKKSKRARKGSF